MSTSSDQAYQQRVAAALDQTWQAAQFAAPIPVDVQTGRYIIFSDQHRGARNGADDFQRSERVYNAALAYYLEQGHTLVVLGDAEELWEEFPGAVMRAYPHTLGLEAQYHARGRYHRVWGNHDDTWSFADEARRHLGPYFGAALPVAESLRLSVREGEAVLGTLFLVHGHQGDTASDQWAWLSRWFVRLVWRPIQRLTKFSFNTPARSWELRERHNIALYTWAQRQAGLVLVAGHTHRPVFKSLTRAEQLQRELAQLREGGRGGLDKRERLVRSHLAAELEWTRAQDGAPGEEGAAVPMGKPCYFNTGCCCYADGDITGLEISEGALRLVRWPDDDGRPRPKVLAAADLRQVLAASA